MTKALTYGIIYSESEREVADMNFVYTLVFQLIGGHIVHLGYTCLSDALEVYKKVDDPIFDYIIAEVFRDNYKYYVPMPRTTFGILRHNEFELDGRRWEVARYL